jgi:hypothetical protein
MEKNNDGQHRSPSYEPDGADTGQRTVWRDRRNKTAVSHEEADKFPTREDNERDQQERMR